METCSAPCRAPLVIAIGFLLCVCVVHPSIYTIVQKIPKHPTDRDIAMKCERKVYVRFLCITRGLRNRSSIEYRVRWSSLKCIFAWENPTPIPHQKRRRQLFSVRETPHKTARIRVFHINQYLQHINVVKFVCLYVCPAVSVYMVSSICQILCPPECIGCLEAIRILEHLRLMSARDIYREMCNI